MADEQQKTWILVHPQHGEVREVTARDYIAGKLKDKGFPKPDDLDDTIDIGPVSEPGPAINIQRK